MTASVGRASGASIGCGIDDKGKMLQALHVMNRRVSVEGHIHLGVQQKKEIIRTLKNNLTRTCKIKYLM